MDPDCYVLSKLASWRRDEGGLGGRPHTRGNGRWGGGNPPVQHQREARRTFWGVNFVRAGSVEVKPLEGGETL